VIGLLSCTPLPPPPTDLSTTAATETTAAAAAAGISDVETSIHPELATALIVRWTQERAGTTQVSARFEDVPGSQITRAAPITRRAVGAAEEIALGIPAETAVEIWITVNGVEVGPWSAQTGPLPGDLPEPIVETWESTLASDAAWLLGSVEIREGSYYGGPFWLFIIDRQGRIVWYRALPGDRLSMFPQVSRDGTHIIYDNNAAYVFDHTKISTIHRLPLDLSWEEIVEVPELEYAFSETGDGGLLYADNEPLSEIALTELRPDGSRIAHWSCADWMKGRSDSSHACYSNAVNWVPETDTVLWSMYDSQTVVEIDRQTGTVLRQFGELEGSWAFYPEDVRFMNQHFPNYTPDGTLMVSSHAPDAAHEQRAWEFEVDEETQTLRVVWEYGEGIDDSAWYAGEAVRLDHGGALINYGSGGAIREVTADGLTAWNVRWEGEQMVGHTTLVDDLYALCGR